VWFFIVFIFFTPGFAAAQAGGVVRVTTSEYFWKGIFFSGLGECVFFGYIFLLPGSLC
jgi:hypothetical protein